MPRQVSSPETKTAMFFWGWARAIHLSTRSDFNITPSGNFCQIRFLRAFLNGPPQIRTQRRGEGKPKGAGKENEGEGDKGVGKEIKRDGGIKGSSRGEKVSNLFRLICGL